MKRAGWLIVAWVAACGGDANVEGDYSISITNRDNGCMFGNWNVGDTAAGIPVVIDQTESQVTATVEGLAGVSLGINFGSNVYEGDVDGDDIFLELFGSRAQSQGNCAFTYNSVIDASINGDVLNGRIEYRTATNGNPDCAELQNCVSFQDFNGTRPPT